MGSSVLHVIGDFEDPAPFDFPGVAVAAGIAFFAGVTTGVAFAFSAIAPLRGGETTLVRVEGDAVATLDTTVITPPPPPKP